MPWVRFDDQYPDHPKVGPLSDRLYRLHNRAIFWCARHTTDGIIRAELLPDVWRKARATDAAELARRGLLHTADDPPCPSPKCPPAGPDGWVVHDYWDYQPRRAAVEAERKAKAERQKRWRAKRRSGDASTGDRVDASNMVSTPTRVDVSRDALVTPAPPPPRPAPKEAGGGAPRSGPAGPGRPPAAADAGGAASGRPTPPAPPGKPDPSTLAETRRALAAATAKHRANAARRADPLAELDAATDREDPDRA